MLGVFAVAALRALDRASRRYGWIGRTRSPGRTLRAVSNHTYTLLGCSTFRYGIKRTTHPLPTEGVIMALRGVAAESATREETPRGEEMS